MRGVIGDWRHPQPRQLGVIKMLNVLLPIGLYAAVLGNLAFLVLWPAILAFRKGHPQRWAILAVTVLTGWTLAGWLFAVVWALRGPVDRAALPVIGDPDGMAQAK